MHRKEDCEPDAKVIFEGRNDLRGQEAIYLNGLGIKGIEFLLESFAREFWKCNGEEDAVHIFNPGYIQFENKNDLANRIVGKKMNRCSLNYNSLLAKGSFTMFNI